MSERPESSDTARPGRDGAGSAGRDGGPGGGSGGGSGGSRKGLFIGGAAVVVIAIVATVVWLFVAGPLSETGQDEREAASVVEAVNETDTLGEFNDLLCEDRRMPEELISVIDESYQDEGTDLDSVFQERVIPQMPDDLSIDDVRIDGDEAVVVTSSAGGETTEEIDLIREDGEWRICEEAPAE